MNGKDRPGPRSDRCFDQAFVDVERVRPDVDEDGRRAPQHEGVGCGDERVGRQNHLVAGAKPAEQGGDFEGRRAGRREENPLRTELRFQKLLDAPGEGPSPLAWPPATACPT